LKAAIVVVVLAFLFVATCRAQVAQNAQIGRSWPRAIVVDDKTNVIHVNTISGDYPLTGFTLSVINGSDNSLIQTIPFNGVPGDMALDDLTGRLYAISSDSVFVFDLESGSQVQSINLGEGLYGIAVVFIVVVALRRGKSKRSIMSVTASGRKLGALLSQQRRGQSWLR
jgi:DNA-binding beta-propeller fold protein YncE